MKNIVLVGFMGTGKSAAGRLVAQRLKRPFVDLDRWIEKKAGRAVAQIFADSQEAGFRKLEQEAVEEVAPKPGQVIAAGGGVLLDEENVKRLKANGILVCLTATTEVILKRTLATLPHRPLLQGPRPQERIEELLALRAPSYALADLTIDTSGLTVKEVAEEIVKKAGEKHE
ncbi:MAG: shikimate kinase [Candidatus Omnitrophica bacterium]|nr:shikimate kinase [Candidatus Omnitrophota bacterium]